MFFFFPDSQDQIDPSFDFYSETKSPYRIRQRDELYIHEVFSEAPIDGLLVSKAAVDGTGAKEGKYTLSQKHRLYRNGVKKFFRLEQKNKKPIASMGDCGAFAYVKERVPPISVDDVIDFYDECGFDFGVSVDHIILGYNDEFDSSLFPKDLIPPEWVERQKLTLDLASIFIERCQTRKCSFTPVGVAQGWSPKSYALAVVELQKKGFNTIALGGMVPLKTDQILRCLEAVKKVLNPGIHLHLFGVTRLDRMEEFAKFGVTSFDSTSPLIQAFKDEKTNYFTPNRTYRAIRVPQVEANLALKRRIQKGVVNQHEARNLETLCLRLLDQYDKDRASIDETLDAVCELEAMQGAKKSSRKEYRELLRDRPWQKCPCEICQNIGINVVMLRGAERNRRRGFHNIFVFNRQMKNKFEKRSLFQGRQYD